MLQASFTRVREAGAPNVIAFEAVLAQGGTLCQNGTWRAFDGGDTGTTPFRVFFKNGVFRGSP